MYPHLGASPDSTIECKCHSVGLLEIKCPYTAQNFHPKKENIISEGLWTK